MTLLELRMRALLVELIDMKDSNPGPLELMARAHALEMNTRKIIAETDIGMPNKRMRKTLRTPNEN